jgi:hypothetical protein
VTAAGYFGMDAAVAFIGGAVGVGELVALSRPSGSSPHAARACLGEREPDSSVPA